MGDLFERLSIAKFEAIGAAGGQSDLGYCLPTAPGNDTHFECFAQREGCDTHAISLQDLP